MQFGEMDFNTEPIGDFLGKKSSYMYYPPTKPGKKETFVDSRDNMLFFLQTQYEMNPTLENELLLQEEEISRQYFDAKFQRLALAFGAKEDEVDDALSLSVDIT